MPRAFKGRSGRLPADISFRPLNDGDLEFLHRLYAGTRADELARVDWDDEQKTQFLTQQFNAQHSFYQEQFGQAEFLVIEADGKPVGRVYVDRRADEIRLIDIALVPEQRNSGLGTALLKDLLDEAQAVGLPVKIHVEKFNPAMRLYQRLGFQALEDQGVYQLMEWRPASKTI